MRRVQKFLLKVKTEETAFKEKQRKEATPLKEKDFEKVLIEKRLKYAEGVEEEGLQLKNSMPKRTNAANDKEHERMEAIRNFLTHTRWQTEGNMQGGAGKLSLILYLCCVCCCCCWSTLSGVEIMPLSLLFLYYCIGDRMQAH